MQYSVSGSDGNTYGPVDLATLKSWVQQGRIMPDTRITDNLSNLTLMASQMPELGIASPATPYSNIPAPPSFDPFPGQQNIKRGTRLWGILFWLALAIVVSMFTRYGGLFISGWNIFDSIKAKNEDDPQSTWCLVAGIGGFVLILGWTYVKASLLR